MIALAAVPPSSFAPDCRFCPRCDHSMLCAATQISANPLIYNGADARDRTADLLITNQLLYR
jgi:hypothetical protein